MALTDVILKVSEEISSGQEVADTYTPPDGAEVWLSEFHGNAAFTTNSAVMLIWDYNGAGETIIWSTKGSSIFDIPTEIQGADGVKKLALVCSNGETGDLVLSGCAKVRVHT